MLRRWSVIAWASVALLSACGGTPGTQTDTAAPTQTRAVELTQVAAALVPTATAAAAATNTPPPATATPPPPTATTKPPAATVMPATATPRPPTSIPPPPTATVPPTAVAVPKVGETAQGKGYTLQLHTLVDPAPTQQYSNPKEGFRWVSFDVTVTNTSTAPLDYNLFYFKVKTADSREYSVAFGGNEPALGSGKQQPGEPARGWVTFEVPVDAALATLAYDPAFGANRVQFDLR